MPATRVFVSIITFAIGVFSAWFVSAFTVTPTPEHSNAHWGYATAKPLNEPDALKPTDSHGNRPLRILQKHKAQYTDVARNNGIEGKVTLRVTFLANGEIGRISVVEGLPHGLTEQAIAAARKFRFEPELVRGIPTTTTRPVTYSFDIY